MTAGNVAIWGIAALATAGVLVRPMRWPEAVWAMAGAAALVGLGLLPWADAWRAVGKGGDVYLFLIGMMLLSETARREGLFEWIAAFTVNRARTSPKRLFLLVYAVGMVVTAFLSNDATAVVLTPAVFAVAKKAKAAPLPYLFICAFIANAASFVLPISNPANLVLYGDHTPPLGRWLASFAVPSLVSVVATYLLLRWSQRSEMADRCECDVEQPPLSGGGWTALAGIVLTAAALLAVSALDHPLGAPTCILGCMTTAAVLVGRRESPWPLVKSVSWSVLPLVAGLFVLVEAINQTGLIAALVRWLDADHAPPRIIAALSSGALALASNVINNLPAGLIASTTIAQAHPPRVVTDALLIGVDLGPNLSITGSLATILWLTAVRREGEDVSFWRFLRVGVVVAAPALALTIAARLLMPY